MERHLGAALGVIPARGGSKGLPGKNVRPLLGKPLIAYTLQAAMASSLSDSVVSTDDAAIAEVAQEHGGKVPFLRPAELAGDEASVWPAVRLSVARWEEDAGRRVDTVVLLQPTSPLRLAEDIDGCLRRFHDLDAEACVSVSVAHDSPYFNMVEGTPETSPFVRACSPHMVAHQRRQECPVVYALNGAVYAVRRDLLETMATPFALRRLAIYEMPRSRSVDIDSEEDLALAGFWLLRRNTAPAAC